MPTINQLVRQSRRDVLKKEKASEQRVGTVASNGYAAQSAMSPLAPFSFSRRRPGLSDVQIEILYCGVCHSDLHTARNEWTNTTYPVVPGHEIVGKVTAVGPEVTRFKVGDLAGWSLGSEPET